MYGYGNIGFHPTQQFGNAWSQEKVKLTFQQVLMGRRSSQMTSILRWMECTLILMENLNL